MDFVLDDSVKVFYSFGEPVNDGFFLAVRRTLDIVDKDIQEHLLVSRHEGVEGTQVVHLDKCAGPTQPGGIPRFGVTGVATPFPMVRCLGPLYT